MYTRHEQRGMLTLGQSIRILIKDRGYRQSTKKDYMSRYSIIHQAKQKKKPLDPPPQLETSPNPISQK